MTLRPGRWFTNGCHMSLLPEEEGDDEIALLGRFFNQMTRQLKGQRQSLVETNQATEQSRRLFDSVLSNVTAGVIGLDAEGRLDFSKRAAERLRDFPRNSNGMALSVLVPEFAAMFQTLTDGSGTALQDEVRLTRKGKLESLLVRMSERRSDDGQLQERGLDLRRRIPGGSKAQLAYMVRPLSRGVYTYGAINVLARTSWGLAERRYKQEQGREIAVYPSYIHLRKYELMAEADLFSMSGVRKVRRSAQRSEFEQIRDYIPGDDRRTVNWKATARRAKLMVNQYQDEKAQQIVSLIDTGRTMKMPFGGLTLLDRAINAALVLSDIALKKDDKVGIITYSNTVHNVLPPARDRGWMHRVMELLYAQRTDFAETDIEALFLRVKHTVAQRSLLVLYTNFESLSAMRRQLPFLQLLARAHLVAVVIFRNTELDQLLSPADKDTMDVYVKAVTRKFIREKELIAKELESHGVLTILTSPEELSVNVLNKYLEIKARGML